MAQEFLSKKINLPCRDRQIEQLYNNFAYKDEPFPESVFIYGGPSTGKSIVIATLLKKLKIRHAIVNLIECYTSKILFEIVLNTLSDHQMDPKKPLPYAKCDNLLNFVANLQTLAVEIDLNGSVLVLDKAEELRNMDLNLLGAFFRFRELTGISISIIFISQIAFEKYYFKTNVVEPIKIHFPQYNKDELLEILSLDIDYARTIVMRHTPFYFDLDFYRQYLNVFLSVFYRACKDLSELRYISRKNFVKYCQPIISKEHTTRDAMALWRNIAPDLKASLEVLYIRVESRKFRKTSTSTIDNLDHSLELPFYAKYLLIAAYLASYNSVKDDRRLFMKFQQKKVKTKGDVKMKSKVSEQLNTQLGPKPFTFDRLLAIFYAIVDDKVGFNNNLLVQVSSLVELQLLSTMSDNCFLEGQKYKCNVNFDFIQGISRMVGFNVRKYLSDFSHM